MIKFLLKGILGDKNRSMLPIIIISIGVSLTILLSAMIKGMMGDTINENARFQTGHVKVMSRAYAENQAQIPNDLALMGVDEIMSDLKTRYPDMDWAERIKFGGLIDVPDEEGESKGQGPSTVLSYDLFSADSKENARLKIESSIVEGRIPAESDEVLIAADFAEQINIRLGDEITFMGSTMNGAMTFENYTVVGTIRFGVGAMDKGTLIMDISDARRIMDMEDAVSEILGFFPGDIYDDERALSIAKEYNALYADSDDEFAPEMFALREQNNLASMLDYVDYFSGLFIGVFVFAMSIVLWNTGLLGGLRRYQEFGIRLALGESKGHIYRTLIYEAVLIGVIGSVVGTMIGLGFSYYLQEVGLDYSDMMPDNAMLMPTVMRAKITGELFYIGFIPGLFAMVLGNMLSGIGIYKRETASLFKELEV